MSETCKHGVNIQYCRACKKRAMEIMNDLRGLAKEGSLKAKALMEEFKQGHVKGDINERLTDIIDEVNHIRNPPPKKEWK